MKNEGISLLGKTQKEIKDTLYKVMALKPIDRIYDIDQGMFEIGG